jgi:hypothetical protein
MLKKLFSNFAAASLRLTTQCRRTVLVQVLAGRELRQTQRAQQSHSDDHFR